MPNQIARVLLIGTITILVFLGVFGSTIALELPPVGSAGLMAHYDAANVETNAPPNDLQVVKWTNLAGDATMDATAAVGEEPTWNPAAAGGLPTVHFDGTGRLTTGSLAAPEPHPLTIFHVGRLDPHPSLYCYWYGSTVQTTRNDFYVSPSNVGKLYAGNVNAVELAVPQGTFDIYAAVYDGPSSRLMLDGLFAAAGGDAGSNPFQTLRIGSTRYSTHLLRGDIAELIVFDDVLSPSDFNQVGLYLAGKYDLDFVTPEPGACILLLIGTIALVPLLLRRRRRVA